MISMLSILYGSRWQHEFCESSDSSGLPTVLEGIVPVTEAIPPIQAREAAMHGPMGWAGVYRSPSQTSRVPFSGYWGPSII